MSESDETEEIKHFPSTHTYCKDRRPCPVVSQYQLNAPMTQDTRHLCLTQPSPDYIFILFVLFSPKKMLWHFVQTVSFGYNSKIYFMEKKQQKNKTKNNNNKTTKKKKKKKKKKNISKCDLLKLFPIYQALNLKYYLHTRPDYISGKARLLLHHENGHDRGHHGYEVPVPEIYTSSIVIIIIIIIIVIIIKTLFSVGNTISYKLLFLEAHLTKYIQTMKICKQNKARTHIQFVQKRH